MALKNSDGWVERKEDDLQRLGVSMSKEEKD